MTDDEVIKKGLKLALLVNDEEIKDLRDAIKSLKLHLLVKDEEIKSLNDHYLTSKNDVHELEMRNKAVLKRMDILNGMLEKAYDEVKQLKSTEIVINNERLRLEDKLVKSGLAIINIVRENKQLKKLRHCTNCLHGDEYSYCYVINGKNYCKDCINCSKWEA